MSNHAIVRTALLITLGWLFAATLGTAPQANAYREVMVTTKVYWGNTVCVDFEGPRTGSPYLTGTNTACFYGAADSNGRWAQWFDYAISGQYTGINPIMGANQWIRCEVWIDAGYGPRLEWTDHADRGDGHDVNCLRTVNW